MTSADYGLLALAGVAQAAQLVHATAHGRPVDTAARAALFAAVATRSAGSLAEVMPDPSSFQRGLQTLREALAGERVSPETARYTLQLIDLARRLKGNGAIADELGNLLERLPADPGPGELGQIYQQTISRLGKRIQVTGDSDLLQRDSVADMIRAELLAGVRFAWLWQQLGGRRWHLVLRRRQLLVALATLESKT
jgi:high frequency lysogenization protein